MEPKTKINVWYAVLAVLLLNRWISAMYAPTRVPYSQFLEAPEKRRVIEVVVTKNAIAGKMRPPGQATGEMTFTTNRVPPDLSPKLARHTVIFRGATIDRDGLTLPPSSL
ncbi:MAG: hypothetical protein KJ621_16310 [Proteobacteria bacterium]|nr:hypothetical protein [Pseudomonadota bacterium]